MKAIDYLKKIKSIDAMIIADVEELATLEALATKTTAVMGGERVQSSGSQQKMADCVVRIAELRSKINDEITELLALRREAREMLCNLKDAECITLLHKRYFLFETWEQIAVEMNYTYKWVSGGLHGKAIAQFQRELEKQEEQKGKIF